MKTQMVILALVLACATAHAAGSGPTPAAPGCPGAGTIHVYGGSVTERVGLHQSFNRVILCNLQHNPNVNAMIAAMAPVELARLSTQFDVTTKVFASQVPTNVPPVSAFLQTSAQRMTAANLSKIRSAFGAETDTAVARYASLSVQSSYFAAVHKAPLPMSRAQILSNGLAVKSGTVTVQGTVVASPVLDMTIYEVYLEYYTAGWTATASAAAAASYVGAQLTAAYAAGYVVGTGIYWITDALEPEINIWIGDQIGGFVEYICKGGKCTKK